MKVALILLPTWRRETPSLGIAYLASVLEKEGYEVERLEFNLYVKNKKWWNALSEFNNLKLKNAKVTPELNSYIDYCTKKIFSKQPDVICFSTYNCNLNLSIKVAERVKKNNLIIFGGPETAESPRKILENSPADFIIQGEGEKGLPELLRNVKNHQKKMITPQPCTYIDFLPYPKFLKRDIENSEVPWLLPILSSRGCVGKCNFCFERNVWKKYRTRKAANVIAEIKNHILNHNINCFRFNDSSLSDLNFIREFCQIDENINWITNIRGNPSLTPRLLRQMRKSGCRALLFGVESGSDNVLKDMNKDVGIKTLQKNIEDAHRQGIWTHCYFITGFPTETYDDFLKTIEFIRNNKNIIDSFDVTRFHLRKLTDLAKKGVRYDSELGLKRLEIIESMFEHKYGFPYQSFFYENDDYKNHPFKEIRSQIYEKKILM